MFFLRKSCHSISNVISLCWPHYPQTLRNKTPTHMYDVKGKAIPLQTRTDSDSSKGLSLPDGGTAWNSVVLENLTVCQLVTKFLHFVKTGGSLKIHKCRPPNLTLSQINILHATPSQFLNIHINILPSTSRSYKWILSLGSPD